MTLKDLDFKHQIGLPPKKFALLKAQIEADSQVVVPRGERG